MSQTHESTFQMIRNFTPYWLIWLLTGSVGAQTNTSFSSAAIRSASGLSLQRIKFTTPAYEKEAFKLVLEEANRVARQLNLTESVPILESNLVARYIPPPGLALRLGGGLGNVTTTNYTYYISVANKFSFLEKQGMNEIYPQLKDRYLWPVSQMDTNFAFQFATQELAAASMDVNSINRDCDVHIDAFEPYPSSGKYFVPIYGVHWTSKDTRIRGSVAEVKFIGPTKTLCELRVCRSRYILRQPLVVTNLDFLLSQTNSAENKGGGF